MMLGARVREVRNLAERCIWMPKAQILLIDADLTPSERAWYAEDWAVQKARALSHLSQIVETVDLEDLDNAETPGDITTWS